MNITCRITGSEGIQVLLFEVIGRVGWHGWKCSYANEVLQVDLPEPVVAELEGVGEEFQALKVHQRSNTTASKASLQTVLGELWRAFEPLEDSSGLDARTDGYLVVVGPEGKTIANQLLHDAPSGLRLWALRSETGEEVRAYRVNAEDGRRLATSPPPGCHMLACHFVEEILIATPLGFRPPSIDDRLWPRSARMVVLYPGERGKSAPTVWTIVKEVHLAEMLRLDVEPTRVGLKPPALQKQPWSVMPRHGVRAGSGDHEARVRSVVFRFKTNDDSGSGHSLGRELLRALDECEAGLLPDFQYCSLERDKTECWHFLAGDQVDEELIGAWALVDRFERVEALAEHGLDVFVEAHTAMVPPFEALLGGSEEGICQAVHQMRQCLGNPPRGTRVLIEHTVPARDVVSVINEMRLCDGAPRITHLPREAQRPLHEVLRDIIRVFNRQPLTAARESQQARRELERREEELKSRLMQVAKAEAEVLSSGIEAVVAAFDSNAKQVVEEVDGGISRLTQLREAATATQNRLEEGARDFEAAVASLRGLASQLTAGRRSWLKQRTSQLADSLRDAAPALEEAGSVERLWEEARSRVGQNRDALERAAAGLESVRKASAAAVAEAEGSRQSAGAAREVITRTVPAALERARREYAEVRADLAAAQQEVARVTQERERVRDARESAKRANDQVRRDEATLRAEANALKAQEAERLEALSRVTVILNEEIPRLKERIRVVDAEIQAMKPIELKNELVRAERELKALEARLTELGEQVRHIESLRQRQLELQAPIQRLEQELQSLVLEVRRHKPPLWAKDAHGVASEALRKIEAMRGEKRPSRRGWWPWRRTT